MVKLTWRSRRFQHWLAHGYQIPLEASTQSGLQQGLTVHQVDSGGTRCEQVPASGRLR